MNNSTHIDFGVKGDTLQVLEITELLQVSPTSGFNPNERYVGKAKQGDAIVAVERNRPSFGVWHLSTESRLNSNAVEAHARLLLDLLQPAQAGIEKLLRSSAYEVRLSIWYVGPSGFDISSDTMVQLAAICKDISVRVFDAE
jgi:hypothetical protein